MSADTASDNDLTIATYEHCAKRYARATGLAGPRLAFFLDRFVAGLAPGATVLEIGSGTGRDASLLEERGMTVRRTDAAKSFVRLMRAAGYPAERLNPDAPRSRAVSVVDLRGGLRWRGRG